MTGRTVGEAMRDAARRFREAGIEDAELEADILLRHALNLNGDRAHLLAILHDPLPNVAAARFEALVARRLAREPTAYIVGHREFYGLELECGPEALIPRPETELLVDIALEWLRGREPPLDRPLVVDVGTGNGALAVALAVHWPRARVLAVDTSAPALILARRNAARHAVADRVAFVRGDLLSPLRAKADLVVANLPYVSADDWTRLAPEITRYEPREALVGGPRGTETIERLLSEAPGHLAPRALLLCEIGDQQGQELRAAAVRAFPDAWVEIRQDLAGLDRVLYVEL
ncbi:MAG TPA: peptide chain release factor N(5)-glutamine methyltransferase [Dehalococcoidia bacterium]|nr:peptide chain release factor N(5)-glutamine methyltransferase [Dehalococcoidia bacterium]